MKPIFSTLLLMLSVLIVLMSIGTALSIGFGALLVRWLPLSLFQASGLAIGATLAFAAIIHVIFTIMHSQFLFDLDDDFDNYDKFENDVPDSHIPFTNEPDLSKVGRNQPCSCGSGKTFKLCRGNTAFK